MRRTTSGTQSLGKWRIWDVHIHAFDGKFVFSAWEEGDESKTRAVAEALAELLDCEIKLVTPTRRMQATATTSA